jgi:hypothetical protein
MSVQRYISSSFWSDDWVDSLSAREKLLYMYLLTNENTTVAGVYKITVKRIKDDTGISREEVVAALDKFTKDKKAFYIDEYIIIPKWPKHQKLGERGKLRLAVNALLKSLPRKIKKFLMQPGHYDYDLLFLGNDNDDQPIPYPENEEKGDRVCQKTDTLSSDFDLDLDIDSKNLHTHSSSGEAKFPDEKRVCDFSDPQNQFFNPGKNGADTLVPPSNAKTCGAAAFNATAGPSHSTMSDLEPYPPDKKPDVAPDFENDAQKLFLRIWQTTPGKIFNALARIESPKEWARWWSTDPPTCDEVRLVMQNVIEDVRCGTLEVRFIPITPDRFVLGGGFIRHKNRFRQTRQTSPPQSNQVNKKSL